LNSSRLPAALDALRRLGSGNDPAGDFARIDRLSRDEGDAGDWFEAAARLVPTAPGLALGVLERGLHHHPNDIALLYLRGNALRLDGQPAAAEAALREVVTRLPTHAEAGISLAYLLREQGRMAAFAEVVIRLWRHLPRSIDGDLRSLTFLVENGRIADAALLLPGVLASPNAGAPVHVLAGTILATLGVPDRARVQFAEAVRKNPDLAEAWWPLASAQRFDSRDDADFRALETAATRADLQPATRIAVAFALAKACDDIGDVEAAVRLLEPANANWRRHHRWDAAGWRRFVDDRLRVRLAAGRAVDAPVVFMVGLPCSGTSLLARRLAADARVRNRGEAPWLATTAARLGDQPSALALADAARLYLAHARQDDAPATVYLDATPMNFRFLDLVAAMLPGVRVIHCRRDPRDVAASLWRRHFPRGGMDFAYDFADIAAMADGHARLLGDARARLALTILDVDYEALVADAAAEIARVRAFIGLYEAGANPSPTAAVLEPIHARSVGRGHRLAAAVSDLALSGGTAH